MQEMVQETVQEWDAAPPGMPALQTGLTGR
jgi:hypothetical protein